MAESCKANRVQSLVTLRLFQALFTLTMTCHLHTGSLKSCIKYCVCVILQAMENAADKVAEKAVPVTQQATDAVLEQTHKVHI